MELKFYLSCLYSNLGMCVCVQKEAGVMSWLVWGQDILCGFWNI